MHNRAAALLGAGLAVFALSGGAALRAQGADFTHEVTAGSPAERYLRVLQVAGRAPLTPWSLRGLSPVEVDRLLAGADASHPWYARFAPGDSGRRARFAWLRPAAEAGFNSAFPAGTNDGAVWAGRGVTTSLSAGFDFRGGPVSLRVQPVAFWAQNADFDLMPNGRTGKLAFANADFPFNIDAPQRFGSGAYARVDPGQSTLRLDVRGVALGASTANEVWGPGEDLPLVLGTNAPGFPHLFLGSSAPWKIGIGTAHARLLWGRLDQSDYSPVTIAEKRRFMTGWVLAFTPRGLDGLEVGASRFFHTAWPQGGPGLDDFLEPFQAFFKTRVDSTGLGPDGRSSPDNQLVSVFGRWVLPRGGVEVWSEFSRNDHAWDLQDALLEPDHSTAYALGARKVWSRGDALVSLRAEWLDAQRSNLQQVRNQGNPYTHANELQGHTQRGQILGSPAAFGGGGAVLSLERFSPRGRWSVDWSRTRIRGPMAAPLTAADSARVDVVQSLGVQGTLFRGGTDLLLRLRGDYEMDRYFDGDAFNLSAAVGLRVGLGAGRRAPVRVPAPVAETGPGSDAGPR
ncbi:MAG TPA: capsule assembly Wzi family protein [Longimicrobiaceae bacterium]|nr:capsule assembly Wzi family protein [Longimicrobiaceae bacterium]